MSVENVRHPVQLHVRRRPVPVDLPAGIVNCGDELRVGGCEAHRDRAELDLVHGFMWVFKNAFFESKVARREAGS